MNRIAIIAIVLLLLISCGPPKGTSEKGVKDDWGLRAEAVNHAINLAWNKQTGMMITGNNIYISKFPISRSFPGISLPDSIKPFNNFPFPGDTDQGDKIEHFNASDLDNGVKYYVSVRVQFPNGALSKPSKELLVVCNPRGEFELSVRYQSDEDGYSFKKGSYARADGLDNDLYYYTKDNKDYLASPSRLDGFLRTTHFTVLDEKGDLAEVRNRARQLGKVLSADRAAVKRGDWLYLQLSDDEFALLRVLEFKGDGKDRKVRLYYSFSGRVDGELYF